MGTILILKVAFKFGKQINGNFVFLKHKKTFIYLKMKVS